MSGETALRERAVLLDELRQIVQSMKNLAFAELQRVSHKRQAQAQAREALQKAQLCLPLLSASRVVTSPISCLVIGAERGFCGAFNTPLLTHMHNWSAQCLRVTWLVASHRVLLQLEGMEQHVVALPGCAASEEAEAVLDAWLLEVDNAVARGEQVWLMHVGAQGVQKQCLWPSSVVVSPAGTPAVKTYLPAAVVHDALARQSLRLTLQGALYESLEQENHWRLAQMQRAQDHLLELERVLRLSYTNLRQSNITNELETLAISNLSETIIR